MNGPSTERERWRQVEARSLDPGSSFVYAVRTTGIYCRVGCASRLPLPRNVEFFHDGVAAQEAGYRACLRCRPDQGRGSELGWLADVCERLVQADGKHVPLAELASMARLTPAYLQKAFKKALGVSPREYSRHLREDRFRQALDGGEPVTQAIFAAGFASSGRAYAQARLGMMPSVRRVGAAGEQIRYVVATSWLGPVAIATTQQGICAVEFGESGSQLQIRLKSLFPKARLTPGGPEMAETATAVLGAIEEPSAAQRLPLDIRGTAFQARVWNALSQIPAGSTISYGGLAEQVGSPKAARAIASACAANRVGVLVPCHRVVRRDGDAGGYRWGAERKRALLDLEASGRQE